MDFSRVLECGICLFATVTTGWLIRRVLFVVAFSAIAPAPFFSCCLCHTLVASQVPTVFFVAERDALLGLKIEYYAHSDDAAPFATLVPQTCAGIHLTTNMNATQMGHRGVLPSQSSASDVSERDMLTGASSLGRVMHVSIAYVDSRGTHVKPQPIKPL